MGFNSVIIENGQGLGYEIFLLPKQAVRLKAGAIAEFYLYENIREDAYDLYGFLTMEELAFFKKLINVSGVGPKSAQLILGLGKIAEIESAIDSGNVDFLTRVSGIGTKTAERIILELKGKLIFSNKPKEESDIEAIDALMKLGYTKVQAGEAVGGVSEAKTTEEKIKMALKNLG